MGRDSKRLWHEMAVLVSQGQGSNCHSWDFIKEGIRESGKEGRESRKLLKFFCDL